ncbi:hypothetical protein [Solimicrobium silvestre]|uniref:Uncharacterized protein n=1 Tax=Solimicrobium silvestre TaxID=2099400 RepID=A0A2S9H421_9BURK|nr:hypothetical protein [Solimicrobium silvestre]PRC94734.1 hypothetical protein S2091_0737 [Solimicrobium silvestre]
MNEDKKAARRVAIEHAKANNFPSGFESTKYGLSIYEQSERK